MLIRFAAAALVLALIAAVLGFGGIAGAMTDIAVLAFWGFIALAIVTFAFNLLSRATA